MSYYDINKFYFRSNDKELSMISTFLIILGIMALFGSGDADDACFITLLLKVFPGLMILAGLLMLETCSH